MGDEGAVLLTLLLNDEIGDPGLAMMMLGIINVAVTFLAVNCIDSRS